MVGTMQPLQRVYAIVDAAGLPTDYFIRWAQTRQEDIAEAVDEERVHTLALEVLADWAAARNITTGLGLTGGGSLAQDLEISLDAGLNDLNDVSLTTPTDRQVLTYDLASSQWVADTAPSGLPTGGSTGQVLTKDSGTDYDVSWQTPSGGGGGAWSLITAYTVSSAVANVPFIGLSSYSDLLIVFRLITLSVSGQPSIRVSTDNGTTYYSTSGNYVVVDGAGTETAADQVGFTSANSTAGRTAIGALYAINTTSGAKVIDRYNRGATALFVASSSPITAIQAIGSSGGNFTGGTIYLFGR